MAGQKVALTHQTNMLLIFQIACGVVLASFLSPFIGFIIGAIAVILGDGKAVKK